MTTTMLASLALLVPGPVKATPMPLTFAYFVPRDRAPVKNPWQRIRLVVDVVSDVYARDLQGKGLVGATLVYAGGLSVVKGDHDASYYNNAPRYDADEQWKRLLPEIKKKVGDHQKQVIVVFAETYDSGPAAHLWPGVIARGAYNNANGGLAVFSAHILQDQFTAPTVDELKRLMFETTPVPGRKAWGHKMNSPRGTFVEDGIGAVAHELAHALGLPHDRRRDKLDIMGNGFRNLSWLYRDKPDSKVGFSEENARLLMSSRYVNANLSFKDDEPAAVRATRTGGQLMVQASDNVGLRAVVVVDRIAGSVISGQMLSGMSQTVRVPVPAGKRLQVIVADEGGHQTRRIVD